MKRSMSKINELAGMGQSIWLDYIRRDLITGGELQSLVGQGLRGITSNPAIFEKAIAGSANYDEQIRNLNAEHLTNEEMYEQLALKDIGMAADLIRPVYDSTQKLDGYVSIEVSPKLAHHTTGTVEEAKRLFALLQRPNVMIKIPATPEGLSAITETIGSGINVNVTLIFGVGNYIDVLEAYMKGIELLLLRGGDAGSVASVASLFVSRVDTTVDVELDKLQVKDLKGTIAIANAKMAYQVFLQASKTDRWKKLEKAGSRYQRLLWASTGTKNPDYPDTMYVDGLIGPWTVNTIPPATLSAFLDHGILRNTLHEGIAEAEKRMERLKELGIDLDKVTTQLQKEGLESFSKAFDGLMAAINGKIQHP
jgi:transaldolase